MSVTSGVIGEFNKDRGNRKCSLPTKKTGAIVVIGGGNSNIFGIFTPQIGEDFQFDEHIFQMGW